MAEYIEREAAKNAFPRAEADAFENCRYCTCLDSEQIGEILDNIPAADVVPVRHGRWIRYGVMKWYCSECELTIEAEEKDFPAIMKQAEKAVKKIEPDCDIEDWD